MLTIINTISKSLSVEISKVLSCLGQCGIGTKQAFSKSRYKISHKAFIELNDTFVKAYYGQGGFQLYADKWLLLGSDGSCYELPWEKALREEFGVADNGQSEQGICMARGVKIWDLLNRLTVCATIGHYEVAEISHFKTIWPQALSLMQGACNAKLLLMADMHYPSLWLMSHCHKDGIDFLFRCRPDFCREVESFFSSGQRESYFFIPIQEDSSRNYQYRKRAANPLEQIPKGVWVRAINFTRPNNEPSCLITSVTSQELDYQSICKLYPYRWGEEVSFYFDKCRTQIENFSAKLPEGIRQDWFANMLATNLAQLLIEDAQQILDDKQKNKPNKHRYQINHSVAVGLVKDEMPKMLFGTLTPQHFYDRMIQIILQNKEPVRLGRSYPRKRKHKLKFPMNLRRVT